MNTSNVSAFVVGCLVTYGVLSYADRVLPSGNWSCVERSAKPGSDAVLIAKERTLLVGYDDVMLIYGYGDNWKVAEHLIEIAKKDRTDLGKPVVLRARPAGKFTHQKD